jgi:hypothetical protein
LSSHPDLDLGSKPRFKRKYHESLRQSEYYELNEQYAELTLKMLIARTSLPLEIESLGIHGKGVIEGSNPDKERFDFRIYSEIDNKTICFVEATGDAVNDNLARILSEKLYKAKMIFEKERIPVFFMYLKRKRDGSIKSVRIFNIYQLEKFGRKEKWLQDEKDYFVIELKHGFTTRQFSKILKDLYEFVRQVRS